MGTEFAQFREWDYDGQLEWFMLEHERHAQTRDYVRALNEFYLSHPSLWEQDFCESGFSWLYPDEGEKNLIAFERVSLKGERLRVVISFSGASQKIHLPICEDHVPVEVFRTWQGNGDPIVSCGGGEYCLSLPPFGGIVLQHKKARKSIKKI